MENISNYVQICEKIGLTESERFQTLDLFEGKDLICVMNHLNTLKKLSEKHNGDLTGLMQQNSGNMKRRSVAPSPVSPKQLRVDRTPKKRWSVGASLSPITTTPDAPSVSSLHDDISTKEEFKFCPELEDAAKDWIRRLLNDDSLFRQDSLAVSLKNGVILCKCINAIQPGTIAKINTSSFNYSQMENIGNYLKACISLGLPKTDLFDTPDLWDKKNMNLVINNIHLLAKHVETKVDGYSGPKISNTSQVKTLYSSSLSEKELSSIITDDVDDERDMTPNEKEMVDWLNSQLSKRSKSLKVPHLSASGIRTGVILIQLLEIITKMDTIGFYEANPQILWHCMQNASLVLRFIYEQTFVELDCKSQEIVLGRVESVSRLLRFLREKFDVDYLFLTVLNEGEDDKLSLADMENTKEVEDVETKAEREKVARLEAEIAQLQNELKHEDSKKKGRRTRHGAPPSRTTISRKAGKRRGFGGALQNMADAADKLQSGKSVDAESLKRPGDMDKKTVSPRALSPFEKILSDISADEGTSADSVDTKSESPKPESPKPESPKPESPKSESPKSESPKPESPKAPVTSSSWVNAARPTKQRAYVKPLSEKRHIESETPKPTKDDNSTLQQSREIPSISVTADEQSAEDSTEASETDSSEYSDSETDSSEYSDSSYESTSDESEESEENPKEDPQKAKEIENRQKRIQQLHKDQEQAAQRAKELQVKQRRETDATKERVLKAQTIVRKKVATELLQTERNYVKSLNAVNIGLIKPLRQEGKAKPILSKTEFKAVFANLQELLKLHKELLSAFEDRIAKHWNDQATVGDIFLQKMNIFKQYREYLVNYNISIVSLQSLKQKNERFKQHVNKFQRVQMRSSRLSLESFLIMPVQRIPRYLLLLTDIKKYTAATHPDFEFLTLSNDILKKTLQQHNSHIDPMAAKKAQKLSYEQDSTKD